MLCWLVCVGLHDTRQDIKLTLFAESLPLSAFNILSCRLLKVKGETKEGSAIQETSSKDNVQSWLQAFEVASSISGFLSLLNRQHIVSWPDHAHHKNCPTIKRNFMGGNRESRGQTGFTDHGIYLVLQDVQALQALRLSTYFVPSVRTYKAFCPEDNVSLTWHCKYLASSYKVAMVTYINFNGLLEPASPTGHLLLCRPTSYPGSIVYKAVTDELLYLTENTK